MPKALHRKLDKEAKKKGMTGKRKDRYVYGTLEKVKKEEKRKRARRKK